MPEPPATPAVRAAKEAEMVAAGLVMSHLAAVRSNGAWPDEAVRKALHAYRDAVAARVTADLLASGTPVHVATDGDFGGAASIVSAEEPTWDQRTESWMESGCLFALTPPGTVHQAVLLMKPEEPNL